MIQDWSPLFLSLKSASLATVLAFATGVLAARLVLPLGGKLRGLADGILTLPMVLPPTVLGFLLLIIFGRHSPVGSFLESLGFRIIFTWWGTVVASATVAFPLVYRTVRAAFEQTDPSILQAARTLGIGEVTIFFRILLPLSWPGALGGAVLGFARALGEFGATLMLAGNIPGKTQTMPLATYFAAEAGDMDLAWGWVSIMVAISLVSIFILNFFLPEAGRQPGRQPGGRP